MTKFTRYILSKKMYTEVTIAVVRSGAPGRTRSPVGLRWRDKEIAMIGGDEVLRRIVEKSTRDPEFRQQLLADPKTAIGRELGIAIPESMTVAVHESDMQTFHVALPPGPNLAEEQLEAISAGLCCCFFW